MPQPAQSVPAGNQLHNRGPGKGPGSELRLRTQPSLPKGSVCTKFAFSAVPGILRSMLASKLSWFSLQASVKWTVRMRASQCLWLEYVQPCKLATAIARINLVLQFEAADSQIPWLHCRPISR